MTKSPSILRIVAVNVLILIAGLVLIELMFGSWFSNAHALYQFTKPRNVTIVQADPFSEEPKKITYSRDENGFRGLDAPVNAVDIITVGGSTTDQRFLDDSATYQAVLAELFRKSGRNLVIANAGIDGQSTIGHIHNFPSWFSQIEGLKAKYVLYYIGINDILRADRDPVSDAVAAESGRLKWQLYIREKSVFYQLYLIAKRYLEPNPFAHGRTNDFVLDVTTATDKANVSDYRSDAIVMSLSELKKRVAELDRLTREFGAKSIFVTQRSARWTRADGKIIGIPEYLKDQSSEFRRLGDVTGVDIFHVEQLVADAIMEQCADVDAICINLMKEIEFSLPADFYDHIHTTSSGARAIGEYLFQKLNGKI